MKDHVGNVRVVYGDYRIDEFSDVNKKNDKIVYSGFTDYYPYGLAMDNRKYQGESYLFGFQGMEQEPDQDETQYHTLFRQYDAVLGRWWSSDPEQMQFPSFSPYLAMGANPVNMVDALGNVVTDELRENTVEPLRKAYENKMQSAMNNDDIDGLEAVVDEYNKFEQRFEQLHKSQIVYDQAWISLSNPDSDRTGGFVSGSKDENGKITVTLNVYNLADPRGTYGRYRHEFEHLGQFEEGKLSFDKTGRSGGLLYDPFDEVEAFQVMHVFGEELGVKDLMSLPSLYHTKPTFVGFYSGDPESPTSNVTLFNFPNRNTSDFGIFPQEIVFDMLDNQGNIYNSELKGK